MPCPMRFSIDNSSEVNWVKFQTFSILLSFSKALQHPKVQFDKLSGWKVRDLGVLKICTFASLNCALL